MLYLVNTILSWEFLDPGIRVDVIYWYHPPKYCCESNAHPQGNGSP